MQLASPPERDRSAILERYRSQHRAMVQRRADLLAELLTDQFTAVHITGYEQPRRGAA